MFELKHNLQLLPDYNYSQLLYRDIFVRRRSVASVPKLFGILENLIFPDSLFMQYTQHSGIVVIKLANSIWFNRLGTTVASLFNHNNNRGK